MIKPYFDEKFKLFPDTPKTLNYWHGFKIVEVYIKQYSKNSWKDIYQKSIAEVYKESMKI